MKKLYIIGAGGFGREVLWLVDRINACNQEWDVVGFIDDNIELLGKCFNGVSVVGSCDYFNNIKDDVVYVVCAIGSSIIKKQIIRKLSKYQNVHFATLIDPSVHLSEYVEIGDGTIICAGSILTTNIRIGNHVIINLDCTLGHDDVIADYVTIYPSVNVSGCVNIGCSTEIGTGSQIIQGKEICDNVIIGAGATIIRDITEAGTYVGSPAKKIEKPDVMVSSGGVLHN